MSAMSEKKARVRYIVRVCRRCGHTIDFGPYRWRWFAQYIIGEFILDCPYQIIDTETP